MSVIRISKMQVRPRSLNPWQAASPRSSVTTLGEVVVLVLLEGGGVVGLAFPAGVVAVAALVVASTLTRPLTLE